MEAMGMSTGRHGGLAMTQKSPVISGADWCSLG